MNERQKRFVEEYRKDFNGTAAARRMGYGETSAKTIAYRFLHDPQVRQALTEAVCLDKGDRVIRELQSVAFSEGSDESGASVKMASKLKALELLGKHLGLFDPAAQKMPTPVTIIEDMNPSPGIAK